MRSKPLDQNKSAWFAPLGLFAVLFLGYGALLFHPELHTACPENDTWNLPIRWSVLTSLREGRLPLWNDLSAFGIPWLATWQTESFYPGTWAFTAFGLSFWNLSGLLHLFIFAIGLYCFLRSLAVSRFNAFIPAGLGLLNGCAYNHLGSNSSMDTMAWVPWVFWSVRYLLEGRPAKGVPLALVIALQVFAGYPQIIFYSLVGAFAYALVEKGPSALPRLTLWTLAGLLLSAPQWIPSVEYFFLQCTRLPAVPENPHFFLPWKNLWTLLDPAALAVPGKPDYVADPTFFYFNLYNGFLPLGLFVWGCVNFRRLGKGGRFFLVASSLCFAWMLGVPFRYFPTVPFPAFLEPAKSWVLWDALFLVSLGLLLNDLFPKDGPWKRMALGLALINLLYPVWVHPLERNFQPGDPRLQALAGTLKGFLGTGRALVLPDKAEHDRLYTPLPSPEGKPLFKCFIPNSNYLVGLPLATFYGSTQPSWGALDASLYFRYVFPETSGTLMDLLGVDLLYVPASELPNHYQKIGNQAGWSIWRNPTSLGGHFFIAAEPKSLDRKAIFTAFASGTADPRKALFLDPGAISQASHNPLPPLSARSITFPLGHPDGYQVVTQNAVPGWRAWVDGHPVELFLADGLFQGVKVSSSDRQVRLSYEPASFRLGLFLGFLGWIFLGVWWGLRLLGDRKVQHLPRRR